MNRLLKIITLGIGISSCASIPSEVSYKEFEKAIISDYGNGLVSIGYDIDEDGYEDLRYFYTYIGGNEVHSFLKLLAIAKDENDNNIFEPEEFIYKCKEVSLINDLKV